jgi:hypothetical protein
MSWPGSWELRILVDDEILLAERCPRGGEAFEIAEVWQRRMLDQGWRQVVPNEARLEQRSGPDDDVMSKLRM